MFTVILGKTKRTKKTSRKRAWKTAIVNGIPASVRSPRNTGTSLREAPFIAPKPSQGVAKLVTVSPLKPPDNKSSSRKTSQFGAPQPQPNPRRNSTTPAETCCSHATFVNSNSPGRQRSACSLNASARFLSIS